MSVSPDQNKQPIDFDDEEEVISLSDSELDAILGSAEISEAPMADIEIDLSDEMVIESEPVQDLVEQTPEEVASPDEAPASEVLEEVASSDEALASEVLEEVASPDEAPASEILEEVASPDEVPASEVLEEVASPDESPASEVLEEVASPDEVPASEILEEVASPDEAPESESSASILESDDLSLDQIADFTGPETKIKAGSDDSFVIIDDRALSDEALELGQPSMIVEDELTSDVGMPELDFAREYSTESDLEPASEPLFEDSQKESEQATQDEPEDEESLDLPIEEDPPLTPEPSLPVFQLEEGSAEFDELEENAFLIEEDHHSEEVGLEDSLTEEGGGLAIDDELVELEPLDVPEDQEGLGRGEIVFEDDESELEVESSGDLDQEEEILSQETSLDQAPPPPEDEVKLVDQIDLVDEAVEFMPEEIVFSSDETIEASPEPEPVPEEDSPEESLVLADGLAPEEISEMRDDLIVGEEEQAIPVEPAPVEVDEGMPERMRDDMRKVLGYLDNLFDELPEDRVKEFASSEYYDIYSRLFKELGI